MGIIFLTKLMNNLGAPTRENRQKTANIILENKELFRPLVSITFDFENKLSIRAAWILEWICSHHNLNWILPHLDEFTAKISALKFDSAIRPCAKICELLSTAYFYKKENEVQKYLTPEHIEAMVETGFDWLITPQKTAVKAYTMTTLYLFGLQIDWIHSELEQIIRSSVIYESKGCESRGKHVLSLIEKHKKRKL